MADNVVGLNEVATVQNLRAYVAEMVGTLIFVAVGTGATIAAVAVSVVGGVIDPALPLAPAAVVGVIAVAHGLGYALAVLLTSATSGGTLIRP